MFSIKDISDKQGLSKNPSTNATEHEISANINTKEGKKKEDEDFDKCWDEYDDQDEDDLSEEDIEKKIQMQIIIIIIIQNKIINIAKAMIIMDIKIIIHMEKKNTRKRKAAININMMDIQIKITKNIIQKIKVNIIIKIIIL